MAVDPPLVTSGCRTGFTTGANVLLLHAEQTHAVFRRGGAPSYGPAFLGVLSVAHACSCPADDLSLFLALPRRICPLGCLRSLLVLGWRPCTAAFLS